MLAEQTAAVMPEDSATLGVKWPFERLAVSDGGALPEISISAPQERRMKKVEQGWA
jgi:hypothetical protein